MLDTLECLSKNRTRGEAQKWNPISYEWIVSSSFGRIRRDHIISNKTQVAGTLFHSL